MREGLDRAQALPVGSGYLQGLVGVSPAGWLGRLEGVYHPLQPLGLYGYGQASSAGWEAGAGARYSW